MKNNRFRRKPKRTTFWKMFAKGMILPVILMLLFAAFLNFAVPFIACEQAQKQQNAFEGQLIQSIQFNDNNDKFGEKINGISLKMGLGTNYYVLHDELPLPIIGSASSWEDKKGIAVSALIDKNGNVLTSNTAKLYAIIQMSHDPSDKKWLIYDPYATDIPELTKFISDHLDTRYSEHYELGFDITSAYVNMSEHKIIPRVIMEKNTIYKTADENDLEKETNRFTKEIIITPPEEYLEGYTLMDFPSEKAADNNDNSYPRCTFENIWGIEKEKVDKAISERFDTRHSGHNYESDYNFVVNESIIHDPVLFNGEKCTLFLDYKVNVWTASVKKMYIGFVLFFFLFLTLLAFLRSWSRNVKNKAQYAFEDYQRALTNNLAHDLKTPLAVIGGYAENLMEMRKGSADEKELKYLSSIMNNVTFTDDIIAKTLKLSETEQIKKLNKTKVDIKALAEKSAEKYRTVLEDRDIEIKIEGKCEVTADEDTLMTAVENLISNAVKYTRDGGSIKITADKKRFTVVNDVSENIDTKDLLMPFVKGDKARSDKSSSGLGLAIASAAAAQNGFRLNISCKNKKFTAVIDF